MSDTKEKFTVENLVAACRLFAADNGGEKLLSELCGGMYALIRSSNDPELDYAIDMPDGGSIHILSVKSTDRAREIRETEENGV